MKIKISVKQLQEWLRTVNPASAVITTTPILQNVLIQAWEWELVLTCTNLEQTIEHKITEWVEIFEKWNIAIPMKLLLSYVSLLTEDFVEIEETSDDGIKIISGTGDIKVKWFKWNDFPLNPKFEEKNNITMEQKEFRKSLDKTIFSSAQQNIRPTLAWIYIAINDKKELVFASTDTFRLSEYISETLPWIWDNNLINTIIPNKTAHTISALIKDNTDKINLAFSDVWIKFSFGNTNLYSRILNGKFPVYSSFFPTNESITNEITLLKTELIQTIKKINLISKEDNYSSVLNISREKITVKTNETQLWNCNIELNWEIKWDWITVWFNSEYLLEVLWVINEDYVRISISWAVSPIFIRGWEKDNYKHIIMPLKINP